MKDIEEILAPLHFFFRPFHYVPEIEGKASL